VETAGWFRTPTRPVPGPRSWSPRVGEGASATRTSCAGGKPRVRKALERQDLDLAQARDVNHRTTTPGRPGVGRRGPPLSLPPIAASCWPPAHTPSARPVVARRRSRHRGRQHALADLGARPVAVDLSVDMLVWDARRRPPAAVADVTRPPAGRPGRSTTPSPRSSTTTSLNPSSPWAKRPGHAPGRRSPRLRVRQTRRAAKVRDAIDEAARAEGWHTPDWYIEIKQHATLLLGTAEDMTRVAKPDRPGRRARGRTPCRRRRHRSRAAGRLPTRPVPIALTARHSRPRPPPRGP